MSDSKKTNVTTTGIVFSSPGDTATNPLAGKTIVVTGTPAAHNATVSGQVPNSTVIISNPA
jgi:hypothetical protein